LGKASTAKDQNNGCATSHPPTPPTPFAARFYLNAEARLTHLGPWRLPVDYLAG